MTIHKPQYQLHSEKSLDIILSTGDIRSLIKGYHRYFDVIVNKLTDPDCDFTEEEVLKLVDYETEFEDWLMMLSPQISKRDFKLFFRNEPINEHIVESMLTLYEAGKPYQGSYLKFMENVAENPSEAARESIYRWVDYLIRTDSPFAITEEGMLLAHRKTFKNGPKNIASTNDNGEEWVPLDILVNGYVSDYERYYAAEVGSIIEMEYMPDTDDINEEIEGIAVNAWADVNSAQNIRLEIHPKDVLITQTSPPLNSTKKQDHVALLVTRALITGIESTDNLLESGVIPDNYTIGWVDEEFDLWKNLQFPIEQAEKYEARGYSFEKALMYMI